MGLFAGILLPELDDDGLRVIRDRRGRLALSRSSGRPRVPTPGEMRDVSTTASDGAVTASMAEASPKPSKESLKAPSSKKSKESLKTGWGIAEDLRLLELRRDGKSWDYIEGKMDEKGKDIAALKTRFNELIALMEVGVVEEEEDKKEKKQEEKTKEESPVKIDTDKKGKEKAEDGGTESDRASKKTDNESKNASSILKATPKGDKNEASGDEKGSKKEKKDVQAKQKEGYVGRHGRGEVRFFNGVPVLYKHSGDNAEQLDAESVAMMHKEAAKHDRNKWLTVVSRVFDKTGIRMDPEVARIALEGSGALSRPSGDFR